MRLLVTRPECDAQATINDLRAMGHEVIHLPLMEIEFDGDVRLPDIPLQAVAITSANGARGLAKAGLMPQLSGTPAIVVGEASRRAARDAGFTTIETAETGNVDGIITHIRTTRVPEDGGILYASGERTSGDLQGELEQSGFTVHRTILYRADALGELPDALVKQLKNRQIHGVLLFSPRTAKIWLNLTDKTIAKVDMTDLVHYCLSENVSNIVKGGLGTSARIVCAQTPDSVAMRMAIAADTKT